MGLLNTYEVTVKVYMDVQASSEHSAASDAQETIEEAIERLRLDAYCKIVDVSQTTNYS